MNAHASEVFAAVMTAIFLFTSVLAKRWGDEALSLALLIISSVWLAAFVVIGALQ